MLTKFMGIDLSNIELFNELAKIIEKTRSILIQENIYGDDVQRLGHCGLCAEFMHSFAFSIMDIEFDRTEDKSAHEISQNFKASILEMAQKSSQLSVASPEIAGCLRGNEIVLDAIPRSIQDLKDWSEKNMHKKMLDLVMQADAIYAPIKEAIKKELKL